MLLVIVIVVVVAGALVVGGAYLLAAGAQGPRRFKLEVPQDVQRFIDSDAAWAATARATTTLPAADVWQIVTNRPLASFKPLFSGPVIVDGVRTYRGVLATESAVVSSQPPTSLTAVGRGVSVPLLVSSFAERLEIASSPNGTTVSYTLAVHPRWIGWLPLRWTGFVARPFLALGLRRALRSGAGD